MYCPYLLALFFLFGKEIGANQSNNPKGKNEVFSFQATLQRQGNSSTVISNYAMTPNQMHELENALNNVVNRLLGPQKRKLSLRSTENENTGIIHTIKVIGDAIFRQIKRLFEALGLISQTKPDSPEASEPDEPGLKSTVYHQLLSIPLRLVPYWKVAQTHLRNHFQRRNYQKRGYKTVKFDFQLGYGFTTDQLKISAIVNAMAMYGGHFCGCLELKEPPVFDLKRTLAHLTNFSPEVTGRRLRSHLEKPIPKCPQNNKDEYNQYHAFLCLALVDNLRRDYYDCLVEIKRVDNCVHRTINQSEATDHATRSAKSSRAFSLNIGNLEDICKNPDQGIGVLVDCKLKSKTKRRNMFAHVLDFFVGDTKRSPKLRRMANRINSMMTKSRMGSETLTEVVTLIEYFKAGVQKTEKLRKAAQRDPQQRSIFARISKVLAEYRKYILDVTYKTVLHVHTAMTTVQKILIQSASTLVGQNLAPNFQTAKSWSSWVESVVFEWSHERKPFPSGEHRIMNTDQFRNSSKRSQSKHLIKVPNEVGFIKSPHEKPLNELIVAMKNLGRQKKPRRTNALVSIANTFLLATMFYECISLLAGAIYYDDSGSMSLSDSAEEDDHWQSSRDKRSSPPETFWPQGEHEQEEPLSATTEMVATIKPNDDKPEETAENSSAMLDAEEVDDTIDTHPPE